MPSKLSDIELRTRQRLNEPIPRYWSSDELVGIIGDGIRDLWRDIVDLKQEHFLVVNTTDVSYGVSATQLSGVPVDVHKVYLMEPRSVTSNSANQGLQFVPLPYNHIRFQRARSMDPVTPSNETIYYEITSQGAPVNAPAILCAPKVTSAVNISLSYVPTLGTLRGDDVVPIPGEADNALIAWTVAYARAKERDDRAPDPSWLAIYGTDKQHLLESLGVRQYQEPTYVEAQFEDYWG